MMTNDEAYEFVNDRIKPMLEGRPGEDVFLVVGYMLSLCQFILAEGVGGNKAVEIIHQAVADNAVVIRENLH